jgi:phospholipid/cholesterol/gamma-HCH transport system substrate-binding protein
MTPEKRGNMPPKKKVTLAEMKVGIFVTIVLVLLSALILQQSWGLNWFKKSVKAVTYLTDVGGLKSGAPVWLAGMEVGRVRKVMIVPPEAYAGNAQVFLQIAEVKKQIESIDPSLPSAEKNLGDLQERVRDLKDNIRIVEVRLDIHPQYLNRIAVDSEVSIESKGLIGDSFIDITPGTFGALPPKRGEYYVIESTQHPGFREIMTGANDVVANFGVLSDQFKTIVKKIDPERVGTGMGDIVQEAKKTVRQANQAFSRATVLIDDMHGGKGSFGRIVSDPDLYQRLTEALEKFNSLAENIQNGKGTISKLINDPALFNAANETLKKAELVMDRIEKGEGTLGKLSKDAEFYEKGKDALGRFASLMDEIEQGKGTMGKLLKDPSLYNNLDQSSAEISKLLYDLRQDPKKYLTIRFRVF